MVHPKEEPNAVPRVIFSRQSLHGSLHTPHHGMVEVYHVARERLNNRCVQTGDGSEAHDSSALLPLTEAVNFDILQGCGIGVEAIRELELGHLLLHNTVFLWET